jgi:hypothetical protein
VRHVGGAEEERRSHDQHGHDEGALDQAAHAAESQEERSWRLGVFVHGVRTRWGGVPSASCSVVPEEWPASPLGPRRGPLDRNPIARAVAATNPRRDTTAVADLSIHLFWTASSRCCGGLYGAYVLSAPLARRFAAATAWDNYGKWCVRTPPGIGRLATSFTGFTVAALLGCGALVGRDTPQLRTCTNYDRVRLRHRVPSKRRAGSGASGSWHTDVTGMLLIASLFPGHVPLVPARRTGRCSVT